MLITKLHYLFRNFSLQFILKVLIDAFSQESGICLFKILNLLLRKLFPILLFVIEIVSKKFCLLFVLISSFRESQSKGGCFKLKVLCN